MRSRTARDEGERPQQNVAESGVSDLAGWSVGWLYSMEFSRM
jgi:hypothetical protein